MATTRVVVAGTFDGIHPGHLSFLKQAKALGDELYVVIARDKTVERRKQHRPARSETERLAAIEQLPAVTGAVLGSLGGDYLARIVELQPDILALGYDQWPMAEHLREDLDAHKLERTTIVRLKPFHPEKYHSSLLRRD